YAVFMTGAAIGILIGIGLCVPQQQYGLITLQMGLGSVAYPVRMDAADLVVIFLTIFTLSYLAAYYPVHYFINRRLKNS
ncbi:MAG: FtsX-like permease family protein, partial [Porphyromonas gingivalis]